MLWAQKDITPPAESEGVTLIYLEQAERLSFDQQRVPDGQLLTGNVRFRHGDALMYCDSAYFYQVTNSFQAFSNVRIVQGDSIFLYGNQLFYDGNTLLAKMKENVRMENKKTTLTTDTLYYDRRKNYAYYYTGGTIADDLNTLRSLRGEYFPDNKQAIFKTDVELENQNFTMSADTLQYNTQTHVANIVGETTIVYQGETTIRSTLGWYNTETEHSALYKRSVVEHNSGQTLTGDTIFYDRRKQFGRVFGHMMLTDSTNHMTLCGNYGNYDQLNGRGMATDSAMAIDWTDTDSLFMHADSMFLDRYKLAAPEPQQVKEKTAPAGSIAKGDEKAEVAPAPVEQDKQNAKRDKKNKEKKPKKNKKQKGKEQEPKVAADSTGVSLSVVVTDSTVVVTDHVPDSLIEQAAIKDSVIHIKTAALPPDSLSSLPDSITAVVPDSTTYNTLRAFWNVRLYRTDLQAICDSLFYDSRDSVMHLYREPILWNENNQITGDNADIYMQNGTVHHAVITGKGIVMQKLDSLHFNQMQGKELIAYVENRHLKRVDVNGNAETIFYPEEDEELIGVNKTLSSYVKIYFKDRKVDRAVLTTLSEGTMYPLDQITQEELYLTQFFWVTQERPKSKTDIFSPTVRTPKKTKQVVSALSKDEDKAPDEKGDKRPKNIKNKK